MSRKEFRYPPRLLQAQRLNFLEHIDHPRRIVPSFIEILQPQHIGLRLKRLGELQKAKWNQYVSCLPSSISRPSSHENERNRAQLSDLAPGSLPSPMPGR